MSSCFGRFPPTTITTINLFNKSVREKYLPNISKVFHSPSFYYNTKKQQHKSSSHVAGINTINNPFRLAIIGSGPAGFYTAQRVLKNCSFATVDMYEALPTPHGLVRYGVAPDHPEVKNAQNRFDEVARDPRYRFVGNVSVGTNLTINDLKAHHDAIVLSYGATEEKTLGIEFEDGTVLKNIFSAREFVGWYNGMPQYRNLMPDLTRSDTAVVIGHGNVALDIARILLMDVGALAKTDITEYALSALRNSKIRNVIVLGRRGPLQVSFTAKELREMMNLPNTKFVTEFNFVKQELETHADLISKNRSLKRLMQIIEKGFINTTTTNNQPEKTWTLKFLRSPIEFIPNNETEPSYVQGLRLNVNRLEGSFEKCVAVPTGNVEELEASLVVKSLGYRSKPLEGVPFDHKRGLIPNVNGKMLDEEGNELPGFYVSGWIKRGPSGVIAATMYDAYETAETILSDIDQKKPMIPNPGIGPKQGADAIIPLLKERGVRTVSFDDWKKVEEKENELGRQKGKPREKVVTTEQVLEILGD